MPYFAYGLLHDGQRRKRAGESLFRRHLRSAWLVAGALLVAPAGGAAHGPGLDLGLLQGASDGSVAGPRPPGCPSAVGPSFSDADRLFGLNKAMSDFGPRPTASPAHNRFIDWLEGRMRRLPGFRVESVGQQFDRWMEKGAALQLLTGAGAGRGVRVSSAVPYSRATGSGGVGGPLVYVPPDAAIADRDVRGKIVVRDFVAASVPNAAFTALQWWTYDPDATLTKTIAESYERDWLSGQRQVDLRVAKDAGAAGLVFAHGFPHEQVKGHYAPYDGVRWGVPAVYVGADEGARLKQAAASGRSARLRLTASEGRASTRALIATLPGASDERLVVTSHTDGINAVWDNGPISMLAMAEHFASLPRACRPRTLQFIFTTAHLFQTLDVGTAGKFAEELDSDYDKGTVAAVLTVEHMGARNYVPQPRAGRPGRVLVPSGHNEPSSFFHGESPALSGAVLASVVSHDLRESIALRGADLPAPRIPPHHSFGGEGGPYHQRLVPTIAFVTGPWTLFNPAFGMEALDKGLLHRQTLVFTDIVHNLETVPREALGGGYLAYRQARNVFCSSSFGAFGLADCPGEAQQGR
jgi:hypothetical protein